MRSRRVRWTTVAFAVLAAACGAAPAKAQTPITLQGAGATFPAPLYQRWFQEFTKTNPAIRVNYQPVEAARASSSSPRAWCSSAPVTRR